MDRKDNLGLMDMIVFACSARAKLETMVIVVVAVILIVAKQHII